MFTTPILGDSISVALRKLFQGCKRSQAIYKFATKGLVSLNSKNQIYSSLWIYLLEKWKINHKSENGAKLTLKAFVYQKETLKERQGQPSE